MLFARGGVRHLRTGCAVMLGLAAAMAARAQDAPLIVGSAAPILDDAGVRLNGTDPAAAAFFGVPAVPGDLVQILQANGGIYPANADGTPHASNTLLSISRIGRGTLPLPGYAGLFGATIAKRPQGAVFARAFNAPSLAQATHYGDSQLFTVSGNAVFLADIAYTDQAFAEDSDGDGINDPWEGHLGSDPLDRDSDGDGMPDGDEFRAGTGLGDPTSNLGLVTVGKLGPGLWSVGWQSVPGYSYRVDYTPDKLAGSRTYSEVSPIVTATGEACEVQVAIPDGHEDGHFRVRLVE